jgi:excinuclease ABC subunit A
MDVILNADHVIDLGPLGGHRGGEIVAEGTPEDIAAHKTSLTGQFVRRALERRRELAGQGNKPGKNRRRSAAAAK